ncbi:hypothetical protein FIBSPDRAFT_664421, partial [Athelia psychrophila]
WTAEQQEEWRMDLCKLLVATHTPWNFVNNPQTRKFFAKYRPEAVVPDRRVLSGRVLDKVAESVEIKTRAQITGKYATGICDGWKNIAKEPVITSMAGVEGDSYLMRSHNMTGQPKTGDQLLEVVKEDLNYMETHYGLRTIAWCTDDGPDGKKMRRLLWTWLPWMVVLVCWAHQINL